MNVQRRNRRKPDMGMPVESEKTAVSETADGLERWLLDDEPRKETRGTASVNDTPESPEGPALVDWDALLQRRKRTGLKNRKVRRLKRKKRRLLPQKRCCRKIWKQLKHLSNLLKLELISEQRTDWKVIFLFYKFLKL